MNLFKAEGTEYNFRIYVYVKYQLWNRTQFVWAHSRDVGCDT
jgi:hypothetical protein